MTETKAKTPRKARATVPPVVADAARPAEAPVDVAALRALVARIEAAQGVKGRQAALVAQLVLEGAEYDQDARLGRARLRMLGLEAFSYLGNAALLANLANAARRAIRQAEAG